MYFFIIYLKTGKDGGVLAKEILFIQMITLTTAQVGSPDIDLSVC